jgi:preprotein translocase subunit SecE
MRADEPVLVIAGQAPEILPGMAPPVSAPVVWPTRRDAVRAALTVACVVGVPALVAVGALLALFALSAVVLLAPVVAAVLTVAAWWGYRAPLEPPPRS